MGSNGSPRLGEHDAKCGCFSSVQELAGRERLSLQDPAFDLHYDELLLWYLCADHEVLCFVTVYWM